MSTAYQWGILWGIIIGIIIVAVVFAYNKNKTGTVYGGEYDERQKLRSDPHRPRRRYGQR